MNKVAIFAWLLAGLITIQTITIFENPQQELDFLTLVTSLIIYAIRPIFAILAALIVSRQPRNSIGWLLFMPATTGILNVEPYIRSFTTAPEQPSLLLLFSLWYATTSWLQLIFPLFFIPVLFPTGRPPTPGWRWLIIAGLGMCAFFIFLVAFQRTFSAADIGMDWEIINPIGFIEIETFEGIFFTIWGIGLLAMAVLSVASLFIRYRRAAAVERVQIKWLLYACALFGVFYIGAFPINTNEEFSNLRVFANLLWQLSLISIPLSITIAILRYRLWDIDLIIRRTLQYGLLTLLLGLVYLGLVVLLGQIFLAISGQESPLVVVISTLAIAALFTPLRRRVQEAIDRRFFRKKYDAEQAIARFTAAAQAETNVDRLTAELLAVVDETVQPERTSLWRRSSADRYTTQRERGV